MIKILSFFINRPITEWQIFSKVLDYSIVVIYSKFSSMYQSTMSCCLTPSEESIN